MNRAVIVICDSLRADLITPRDAPFLTELGQRSARFANHAQRLSLDHADECRLDRDRVPAGASRPARQHDGARRGRRARLPSVGKPDFRDRLHRATGRTLHPPTLAERLGRKGGTAIAISNVSPGAAYFLDPDGYGWVYNPAGSSGPAAARCPPRRASRSPRATPATTSRPSGSARRCCAARPRNRTIVAIGAGLYRTPQAARLAGASPCNNQRRHQCPARRRDGQRSLDPSGENILFIVGSDHGMETVDETIDLEDC